MSEPVYRVEVHPAAVKQLERLYRSDRKLAARFDQHIRALVQIPYPKDVVILERTEAYDMCRTRVGRSWRLIYAVIGDRAIVLVVEAISRQSAYKADALDTLRNRIQAFIDTLSR
jgi:mRNA-degrading endonuclease RelE of RelBE toxin-antitoxin system